MNERTWKMAMGNFNIYIYICICACVYVCMQEIVIE